VLILGSGGVTRLAERSQDAAALVLTLRRRGLWPPTVPSAVLVECLSGQHQRDANASRLLKACRVATELPERLARRAALLRSLARRGSAIDAIVVASAEPGGAVLTGDVADLSALAAHAADVTIEPI
jgi:hypothetical protein